jgi:SSS family solute:Na+ symporter
LGIFFKRLNGKGAMASLLTGLGLGVLRLVLEFANGTDKAGLAAGSMWERIAEFNFLHYAVVLFVICTAVLFAVSMATPAPSAEKTAGLTYAKPVGGAAVESSKQRQIEIGLSVLLVAIIGVLWIVFR